MHNKFLTYNKENQLFNPTDKILLTVSGGMDSVFMVHLFLSLKLNFGIAHCNFKLRGEDADADEQFVSQIAQKNNIPFFKTAFKTKSYAAENGISIQMAARDLRYAWFEKIRTESNYNYIATAHHKNDVAETMLINLSKGTGLAGLHGIKAKKDRLIRPLLCFKRKEIEGFVIDNNIAYREDKSNADTKYVRNKIRHQVLPELEKINPSLIETLNQEAQQFNELEEIVNQKIEEIKQTCFVFDHDFIKVNIKQLSLLTPLKTYLYYLIKDFGFNSDDVLNIIDGLKEQSGKQYFSATHQLVKDRAFLIIAPITSKNNEEYILNSLADFEQLPISITVDIKENSNVEIDKNTAFAYLDFDKIKFPLIVRKWQQGDVFQPLGMKGNKKVSDFFIDKKLSLIEKENAWMLLSDNKICWIIGVRISDAFKLSEKVKKALILHLK